MWVILFISWRQIHEDWNRSNNEQSHVNQSLGARGSKVLQRNLITLHSMRPQILFENRNIRLISISEAPVSSCNSHQWPIHPSHTALYSINLLKPKWPRGKEAQNGQLYIPNGQEGLKWPIRPKWSRRAKRPQMRPKVVKTARKGSKWPKMKKSGDWSRWPKKANNLSLPVIPENFVCYWSFFWTNSSVKISYEFR